MAIQYRLLQNKIDFPAAGSANGIIDEDDMRLLIGIVVCGVWAVARGLIYTMPYDI